MSVVCEERSCPRRIFLAGAARVATVPQLGFIASADAQPAPSTFALGNCELPTTPGER